MIELKAVNLQRLALTPNIEFLFLNEKVIGLKICDNAYINVWNLEFLFGLEGWENSQPIQPTELDSMVNHLEELLDIVALQF